MDDMVTYDVCLAWNWEYDADFVALFDKACQSRGLSLLQIRPDNIEYMLLSLKNKELSFCALFDRASVDDERFIPVVRWARDHDVYRIDPDEFAFRADDKASMHLALIGAGIYTPYTIVLPSYREQPDLQLVDISPLGERFTIKPAHGGGGEGVVIEATSWNQVVEARKQFPEDKYLVQAYIVPVQRGPRPAWFRVIYCAGQVYPCWWDTRTRVYTAVTSEEENYYSLTSLRDITASIARICRLQLFSTEIALTPEGLFVVVDYVNDQLDLRLQSKAADGVPDVIVCDIAERLTTLLAERCQPQKK
ncbi:MAG: hypothetical protein JW778_07965 [Candidatus Altiarchaeota archaeon]|nr:hypothetical protein [Candidatus Altiarchaeota archaeon]